MQHSRSLGSFASLCADSETERLIVPPRPRNRSSLDTFVIPGRTRIPSHNPEAFDVQVTQSLLRSSMDALPRQPPPYTRPAERQSDREYTSSAPSTGSQFNHDVHYEVGESLYRLKPNASQQSAGLCNGSHNGRVIPHRRPHKGELRIETSIAPPQQSAILKQEPNYDGAHDSGRESRVTSTTYSVISRRIFTDSSGSSGGGAVRFNEEYNYLAAKHGLPEINGHICKVYSCAPSELVLKSLKRRKTTLQSSCRLEHAKRDG